MGKIFIDSSNLVTEGHHKALPVTGYRPCLGEHVLYDDVSFQFAYLEVLLCVFQGYVRVFLAMQGFAGVLCLPFPPVIEEEIMEEATPGSRFVVEAKDPCDSVGNIGDTDYMVVDVVRMVEKSFELVEFRMQENIAGQVEELPAMWPCNGKERAMEGDANVQARQ